MEAGLNTYNLHTADLTYVCAHHTQLNPLSSSVDSCWGNFTTSVMQANQHMPSLFNKHKLGGFSISNSLQITRAAVCQCLLPNTAQCCSCQRLKCTCRCCLPIALH